MQNPINPKELKGFFNMPSSPQKFYATNFITSENNQDSSTPIPSISENSYANRLQTLYHSLSILLDDKNNDQSLQGNNYFSLTDIEIPNDFENIIKIVLSPNLSLEDKIKKLKEIVAIEDLFNLLDVLLQVNAELEHQLMLEYLYIGYSINPSKREEHKELFIDTKNLILTIAKEEMGHFVTVQNIRKFLGFDFHFSLTELPHYTGLFAYATTLEKFSLSALCKYIIAEAGSDFDKTPESDEIYKAAGYNKNDNTIIKVSQFFKVMLFIFEHFITDKDILDRKKQQNELEESIFNQAKTAAWNRGYTSSFRTININGKEQKLVTANMLVEQLSTRWECIQAITEVAEQGESPSNDSKEETHFSKFFEIYNKLTIGNININDYVINVPNKELNTPLQIEKGYELAEKSMQLLDLRYSLLLRCIQSTFEMEHNLVNNSESYQGLFVSTSFGEMYNIKALSNIVTTLPIKIKGDSIEYYATPQFNIIINDKAYSNSYTHPNRHRNRAAEINPQIEVYNILRKASETINEIIMLINESNNDSLKSYLHFFNNILIEDKKFMSMEPSKLYKTKYSQN